jgi:predicted nucleotide-binding protein (sugar kinase/HSP70/actin superfamily)
MPYADIPKISLVGEIYVRHDPLSLQQLNERLAARGFIVRTATNSEWINYIDWLIMAGIEGRRSVNFWKTLWFKRQAERRIRDRLMPSGLFAGEQDRDGVGPLIEAARRYISPDMTCEAILTVGSAMHEILEPSCGIISLGPFGCMPSRVAEAVLNSVFTTGEKRKVAGQACKKFGAILERDQRLPFIAIETDGTPFPQVVEARLEVFLLQASRLHRMMQMG